MLNKMTLKLGVAMAMLLVVGSAFAQGGGGGQGRGLGGQRGGMMGGGQGSLQLLTRKDVQDDLVITAEQKKKIDDLNTAAQSERQKMMPYWSRIWTLLDVRRCSSPGANGLLRCCLVYPHGPPCRCQCRSSSPPQ